MRLGLDSRQPGGDPDRSVRSLVSLEFRVAILSVVVAVIVAVIVFVVVFFFVVVVIFALLLC